MKKIFIVPAWVTPVKHRCVAILSSAYQCGALSEVEMLSKRSLSEKNIINFTFSFLLYNKQFIMTNEMKKNYDNHVILTNEALLDLKEKGYKYLQVQGYTLDHHLEYVEPHYLMLVPVKDFSDNRAKMGIYEDISSETVVNWANNSNEEGFEIFLAVIKP